MSGAARAPRTIGPVTTGAATGSVSGFALGTAAARLVVLAWPQLEPAEEEVALLLGAALTLAGALLGGWLVRSPEPDTPATRAATTENGPDASVPGGH